MSGLPEPDWQFRGEQRDPQSACLDRPVFRCLPRNAGGGFPRRTGPPPARRHTGCGTGRKAGLSRRAARGERRPDRQGTGRAPDRRPVLRTDGLLRSGCGAHRCAQPGGRDRGRAGTAGVDPRTKRQGRCGIRPSPGPEPDGRTGAAGPDDHPPDQEPQPAKRNAAAGLLSDFPVRQDREHRLRATGPQAAAGRSTRHDTGKRIPGFRRLA